jgi:hypothetical protein
LNSSLEPTGQPGRGDLAASRAITGMGGSSVRLGGYGRAVNTPVCSAIHWPVARSGGNVTGTHRVWSDVTGEARAALCGAFRAL